MVLLNNTSAVVTAVRVHDFNGAGSSRNCAIIITLESLGTLNETSVGIADRWQRPGVAGNPEIDVKFEPFGTLNKASLWDCGLWIASSTELRVREHQLD